MSLMWFKMVFFDLNLILNVLPLLASDEMISNFYNEITSSLIEIPNDLLQKSPLFFFPAKFTQIHKYSFCPSERLQSLLFVRKCSLIQSQLYKFSTYLNAAAISKSGQCHC